MRARPSSAPKRLVEVASVPPELTLLTHEVEPIDCAVTIEPRRPLCAKAQST
jgi:hypothetical protein